MTDQAQSAKRQRGRPPKYAGQGKRQNFSFRITPAMREWLIAAVQESGRSISEEIEFRLNRDHGWEATKGEIDKLLAEARTIVADARIRALRLAGLVILREIDAKPTRVVLDVETLLAEADGIAHGLRGGFVDPNAPASDSARLVRTEDENRRLRAKIEELTRRVQAAQSEELRRLLEPATAEK